jgi:hypothetical protein|tara:strand:- start:1688 stop:2239 length:552 start_codon:yes stop_codon:yes gene_type:complete
MAAGDNPVTSSASAASGVGGQQTRGAEGGFVERTISANVLSETAGNDSAQEDWCSVPTVCAVAEAFQSTEFGTGAALGGADASASQLRSKLVESLLQRNLRGATRVVDDIPTAYFDQLTATSNAVKRLGTLSHGLGYAGAIPSAAMYGVNMVEGNHASAAVNAMDRHIAVMSSSPNVRLLASR